MSLKNDHRLTNIAILLLMLLLFFLEADTLNNFTSLSDSSNYTMKWYLFFGEIISNSNLDSSFILSPAILLLLLPFFRKKVSAMYIFITLLGIILESIFFYSVSQYHEIGGINIGIIKSMYSYWNSLEQTIEHRTFLSPFFLYITALLISFRQSDK